MAADSTTNPTSKPRATPATRSPAKTTAAPSPTEAVDQAVADNSFHAKLPVVGTLHLPPVEHLAFYASVGLMAAIEVIEWPVALVITLGKMLADNRSHSTLRSLGEAMEEV
jgi:hypothetical protein